MTSASTNPSRRRMMRWVCAATLGSCVTMIRVVLRSWFSFRSSSMISLPDLRIQVAGRLIRHDDGRVVDQGTGDGHALLLPA